MKYNRNKLSILDLISRIPKESLHYRVNTDDDVYIIPELIDRNMYQFEHLAALEPSFPSIILDCGAHIGIFSILSSLVFKQVEIHAFEPQPDNYELLKMNVETFERVVPHAKGVGISQDVMKLYQEGTETDGYTGRWTLISKSEQEKSIIVPVINLNEFILSSEKPIFILKLDLEGYESAIIQHLSDEALRRIKILIVEEHNLPINHQKINENGFALDFNPLISKRHFVFYNKDFWKVVYKDNRFNFKLLSETKNTIPEQYKLPQDKLILQQWLNNLIQERDQIRSEMTRYNRELLLHEEENTRLRSELSIANKIKDEYDRLELENKKSNAELEVRASKIEQLTAESNRLKEENITRITQQISLQDQLNEILNSRSFRIIRQIKGSRIGKLALLSLNLIRNWRIMR